jgi:hypothetical protein
MIESSSTSQFLGEKTELHLNTFEKDGFAVLHVGGTGIFIYKNQVAHAEKISDLAKEAALWLRAQAPLETPKAIEALALELVDRCL